MPPRGASTRLAPMRLPVQTLRVKRPNKHEPNACTAIMSSVLSCWAAAGHSVQGCLQLENQLRACMDAPKAKGSKKNTINYHLTRMFPKMSGPRKRKGSLG